RSGGTARSEGHEGDEPRGPCALVDPGRAPELLQTGSPLRGPRDAPEGLREDTVHDLLAPGLSLHLPALRPLSVELPGRGNARVGEQQEARGGDAQRQVSRVGTEVRPVDVVLDQEVMETVVREG